MRISPSDSVLVLVDMQPSFMANIYEIERVTARCKFLLEIAQLLEIPVLATEQYPERMKGTLPELAALLPKHPFAKMAFSCCGSEEFQKALRALGREQVILIGIETHICVTQTTLDLIEEDFLPYLVADAISARTREMHKIGLKRLQDSGALLAHSESVAYEWAVTAEHPKFKEMLAIVKRYAG
ncbi:MAG: isochorismatase family protein [Fimbriimonadaceae bacterium]|jgi:nicotinamidase-related amidase|nr:isochorismatase family protein [Fimbriimonadaceae bacterium]